MVYDAGSGQPDRCMYVLEPGAEGKGAWVFPSGRIVVAHRGDLSASRRSGDLQSGWSSLAAALAAVTAPIDIEEIAPHFRRSVEFYTERPRQYQFLLAIPGGYDAEGILDWPDAKAAWAGITATGGYIGVYIAGRRLPTTNYQWVQSDLSDLLFGDYSFKADNAEWLRIDAFFPEGDGRIALRNREGTPVTDRETFSAEIGSLYVPVCPAYCEWY
ncbi:MAG: hypothetical protein KAX19_07100, partial [Candidatus Brocadiae bacterium]|nr:hypothetical protein [Candidatus Brocadiia bacterium]